MCISRLKEEGLGSPISGKAYVFKAYSIGCLHSAMLSPALLF